jgi:hypothetical protein
MGAVPRIKVGSKPMVRSRRQDLRSEIKGYLDSALPEVSVKSSEMSGQSGPCP